MAESLDAICSNLSLCQIDALYSLPSVASALDAIPDARGLQARADVLKAELPRWLQRMGFARVRRACAMRCALSLLQAAFPGGNRHVTSARQLYLDTANKPLRGARAVTMALTKVCSLSASMALAVSPSHGTLNPLEAHPSVPFHLSQLREPTAISPSILNTLLRRCATLIRQAHIGFSMSIAPFNQSCTCNEACYHFRHKPSQTENSTRSLSPSNLFARPSLSAALMLHWIPLPRATRPRWGHLFHLPLRLQRHCRLLSSLSAKSQTILRP